MAEKVEVSIGVTHAIVAVFVFGVLVGGVGMDAILNGTGFNAAVAADETGDGTGTGESAAADKTIQISGTEYRFSPSSITVQKGQTVRVEFTNTGQIPHNLKIPSLGVGTSTIGAGQTDSFTFTAPRTGTFPIQFECTLPGHAAKGMAGEITSAG